MAAPRCCSIVGSDDMRPRVKEHGAGVSERVWKEATVFRRFGDVSSNVAFSELQITLTQHYISLSVLINTRVCSFDSWIGGDVH